MNYMLYCALKVVKAKIGESVSGGGCALINPMVDDCLSYPYPAWLRVCVLLTQNGKA